MPGFRALSAGIRGTMGEKRAILYSAGKENTGFP
jgi:hypothetical protein